ncbi:uncharacterized protein DDB_G0290685-like [Mercenaria mercenaria]|uniref:uncharacterized protein DDB_G0290685-like n=1 Tax=Mercenaria mercenaria TaxID=6596 RepID=UPI00234EFF00|nr:uncharacterized protein DDB_G0290685-like [Mercenaria mercenaria]
MDEGGLAEEIQVLEAIYIEELEVQRNDRDEINKITLQLHPATGEDLEQRFVCMTLILDLSPQYPDVPPEITIKNPRGIAEEELLSLREDMHKLCEDRQGGPVLFELIELAKDSLTAGNIPHCPCMICLEHFHEGEKFTKTECYHYFHESCLSRYVTHVLTKTPEIVLAHAEPSPAASKLVCPVCREEIHYKFDDFDTSPLEDDFVFTPTDEMREVQAHMAAMLEQQRAKGGIIDVEAERNKYLVKNDDVVLLTLPKAETKEKPDRPKSAQSRHEKVNQESIKGNVSRQSDIDGRKQGSNRNDKVGYRKGRGRGYRYNGDDSTRDNENRVRDRRDKRKTENTSDNVSRKMNNESDNIEYNSIKENRNKGNADSRNRRNYQYNYRRKPGEVKDKFQKDPEGDQGETSYFENPGRNDRKDMEKVKEKKLGFGRPPENETIKSLDKGDSKTGAISDTPEEEIPDKDQKGFGKPKRKDENRSDTNEDVTAACPPADNCNENQGQSLESKTVLKEKSQQELDKVYSIDGKGIQTANDRTFQGNRGGLGRPPHEKDDNEKELNKGDCKSSQNNQTHRRGGFGRPDREYYRDKNFTREKPRQNRGGFGKPGGHNKESSEEMSRPGSGKYSSQQDRRNSPRNHEEQSKDGDKNLTRERPRQNRGGFGKPGGHNKESSEEMSRPGSDKSPSQQDRRSSPRNHEEQSKDGDENFTREKPRQNRGGFGQPGRHNKETLEEMSRPDSGKSSSQQDRRSSPRNHEEHYKDGNENFTREKPRQNRGGFGKPDRHNKERSEEMSRQGSGKYSSQQDSSSPRNLEEQFKDGDRPWNGNRHRYNKDDRHNANWRSHGRNNRYNSDENWEYSNDEKSYNQKASRNQGSGRYYDRHERGFHKDRGFKPKYGTENEVNKPGSRNKNVPPRFNEHIDKDVEKIDRKLDSMVVSENSLELKNAEMFESDDKLKMNSSAKDCDKNEFSNTSKRPLSSDIRENSDSKGGEKKGPPGFVTSPPPGFERTERDSMSMVKPPPGFKK